jgi:hypothetical protein
MSILSKKIKDYNDLGRNGGTPKENVKTALDAYGEMKPALTQKMRQKAKPKVFKVDIKEEPAKKVEQSYNINMFNSNTVVEDLSDIGLGSTNKKAKEDREIDFASLNGGSRVVQLKCVDYSNLYKVEADNVLNLNPFQVSFSASELDQYTHQNPMLDSFKNEIF